MNAVECPPSDRPRRWPFRVGVGARRFAGFGLLALVAVGVWLAMPPRGFFSPDEGAKTMQMLGMGVHPFGPVRLVYPGMSRDPELFYYPARAETLAYSLYPAVDAEGRVQTNWPPWFPLATKPFHAWLGARGLTVIPLMAGLAALWLTGALAAAMEPRARFLAMAAFGLASPLLFYGVTFWEHTPALVLQLAALACLWPTPPPGGGTRARIALRIGGAAVLLLAAMALRREAVFFAAALVAARFLEDRRAWQAAFARWRTAILAAALALVALLVFLPPWLLPDRTGIDLAITLYHGMQSNTWRYLDHHFFNVFLMLNEEGGPLPGALRWIGQIGLLACVVNAVWPRARRWGVFAAGAALVLMPAVFLVWTPERYRALHSLALAAPFGLFALMPDPTPGSGSAADRYVRRVALLFALFYFVGTLPTHRTHGGLEWGSRYAMVLFSLLAALGAVRVVRWWRAPGFRGGRRAILLALAAATLLAGAGSAARGLRELHRTKLDLARIEEALDAGSGPVVTDWTWLATALTDLYARSEIYTIVSPVEWRGWLDDIGRHESVFRYATYEPLTDGTLRREAHRVERLHVENVCGLEISTFRVLNPVAR